MTWEWDGGTNKPLNRRLIHWLIPAAQNAQPWNHVVAAVTATAVAPTPRNGSRIVMTF